MKINEVFEGLIKNKDNVYEMERGNYKYQLHIKNSRYLYLRVFRDGEEIMEMRGDSGFNGNFTLDNEWRQVRKLIPWQKAIQAWIENKDFTIELNGKIHHQSWRNALGCFTGERFGFFASMFTQGKWYVEGEEK